jgi:hypothetical protein
MINTHLVLVSLSVYTFEVSNTTFLRQGQCLDAYACKERLSSGEMLASRLPRPAHAWCDHTTETQPYV